MKFGWPQVAELAFVTFADFSIQRIEQNNPAGGDAHMNDAAIIGRPFTIDQVPLGKFIHQSGDVRGAGYQTGGQVERGHFFGLGGAQQPKRIILLGGEIMAGEELVFEQP